MSLTDAFRQRTAPQLQLGNRFRALPRSAKWSLSAVLIAAFYLTPYWPDVPVLGWIINTPGTSFENVLTDQIMMFILVALGSTLLWVSLACSTLGMSVSMLSARTQLQ